MKTDLRLGDCREVVKSLAADGVMVDSIVCDPPYDLVAMTKRFGKAGSAPPKGDGAYMRSAKGFMGKVWDGTGVAFQPETWEAMASVLRPGGIILAFGAPRTYHRLACAVEDSGLVIMDCLMWLYGQGWPKRKDQLKPAYEPIVMAYKPGGPRTLRIDDCRVGHVTVSGGLAQNPHLRSHINGGNGGHIIVSEPDRRVVTPNEAGRWPANVIHDGSDEVMEAFAAFGEKGGGFGTRGGSPDNGLYGKQLPRGDGRVVGYGDTGTAARFFYCPKASQADRNEGLDEKNPHPTVKPTELMRYLCRLVTPPGGVVLDPFMGSGSTGKAAALEKLDFIGIEMDAEYLGVARKRIEHVTKPPVPKKPPSPQFDLFGGAP